MTSAKQLDTRKGLSLSRSRQFFVAIEYMFNEEGKRERNGLTSAFVVSYCVVVV